MSRNKSRYAVLGMLSLKPMSGYDIKKNLEKGVGNFWNEGFAQIYPILKQFVEEGLATCHTESQEGRPKRNIYTITEAGRNELVNWLSEPAGIYPMRVELLLKLFFAHNTDPEVSIRHVEQFQSIMQKKHEGYLAEEKQLIPIIDNYGDRLRYQFMALRFAIHYTKSVLDWCEETLQELKKIKKEHMEKSEIT